MASEPPNGSIERRATWLVLADDGPALELQHLTPVATRVRTLADPRVFNDMLAADRPRIAIVAEPPAGPLEVELVARERRRRQGLRTIHLSAEADRTARLAALRDGYDEALPQTIDAGELAARANLLEERSRIRSATCLPIAEGYELDLVAHELRVDGRPVHLRPKEFQLLARQLLDRVWGLDLLGDPRTVDVHIRWLRSKIEPQPDRPIHLVTVRGVGYRLDPPLTDP
jgi:DNA-binding response OmpR family regulator